MFVVPNDTPDQTDDPPATNHFPTPFGESTALVSLEMAKEAPAAALASSPPYRRSCAAAVITTVTEAAKLLARNPKLAVMVFHLVFLPFYLLVLLHSLFALPLLERVEDAYETSSLDPNDAMALVARESVFLLSFSVVSFLGMMIVVQGSDLVYAGIDKGVRVHDLLTRVWSVWKTPLVAWLSVSFFMIAYAITVVATVRLANDVNIWWRCLVMVLAVAGYLRFAAIGNLVLIVSVLEDGIGDLKSAVTRCWKLMRGKLKDGFGLMLVLETMSIPIYVVFFVTTTDDDDVLGLVTRLGFGYVATLLFTLAKFFSFVVFTVFYYECRKTHWEKLETELGHGCCCYKAVVPHAVADDFDLSIP